MMSVSDNLQGNEYSCRKISFESLDRASDESLGVLECRVWRNNLRPNDLPSNKGSSTSTIHGYEGHGSGV